MRPKFFTLIFLLVVWVGLIRATDVLAQPPKILPIVPAIGVVQTPYGLTGWCGQDFILFHAFQGADDQVIVRVVRFSNDPRGRAVKYHYYDGRFKLIASAVHVLADSQTDAPTVYLVDPPGFWHSYVYHSENSAAVGQTALVTVVVLLRQKKQDCLLTKEVRLTGGKG